MKDTPNQKDELLDFEHYENKLPVLEVDEVVRIEQHCARNGYSLHELMQRAGTALAKRIIDIAKNADSDGNTLQQIVVLAGSGNNGGDGWVAAQFLARSGFNVCLVTKSNANAIEAEPAHRAALEAEQSAAFNIVCNPDRAELRCLLSRADVIIDAILGTGFKHLDVREPFSSWIKEANAVSHDFNIPIVSADCPSGLNAQTGDVATDCIEAAETVTMIAAKTGLVLPSSKRYVGKLYVALLGVSHLISNNA